MFQVPSHPPPPRTQLPPPHLLDPPLADRLASGHVSIPPEPPPHLAAQLQAAPPHQYDPLQSPHLLLPQPAPPHLSRPHPYGPPALDPHPQPTAPPFAAQPQLTPPHLLPPPHQAYQNQDCDWTRTPDLSYPRRSDPFSFQNQNHLNLSLLHHHDPPAPRQSFGAQAPPPPAAAAAASAYHHPDGACPLQDPARCLEAALSQLQCPPQEDQLGRWGLVDFGSPLAEDAFGGQYYQDAAPQPFCSPATPGPSPQYPQTPTLCSPPMQPWEDARGAFPQLSACGLQEYDAYPPQQPPPFLASPYELIQDQPGGPFDPPACSDGGPSPQVVVSSSSPSPGLSWRGDRGGGGGGGGGRGPPDWTWLPEVVNAPKKCAQPKKSGEDAVLRLLCTVCKRDFRSLPALNGHMRSHSGARTACSGKIEDSAASPSGPAAAPATPRGRGHKRVAPGRAAPYRSLLREDGAAGEGRYTPPPMLCPVRAGPGLFCSLAGRRPKRAQATPLRRGAGGQETLSCADDARVATETGSPPPHGTLKAGAYRPQINVGRGFQAEVPPLRDRKHAGADPHNALQLWSTWEGLDLPANQQRVEALLMMARSSVVPGGGASPESALHALTQCGGDFVLTVEKLLWPPPPGAGEGRQCKRVGWSEAEKRLMLRSLQLHQKDFGRIQRAVQTRSVSECVEFYYRWKKRTSCSSRGAAAREARFHVSA